MMSRIERIPPLWRLVIAFAIATALLKLQIIAGAQPPEPALFTLCAIVLSDLKMRHRPATLIASPLAVALVWTVAGQLGERAAWVAGAGAVATLVLVRRGWAER